MGTIMPVHLKKAFDQLDKLMETTQRHHGEMCSSFLSRCPWDARASFFNVLMVVFNSVYVGIMVLRKDLTREDWWQEANFVFDEKEFIENLLARFDQFLKNGLYNQAFSVVEQYFRIFLRHFDNTNLKNNDSFTNVSNRLFNLLSIQRSKKKEYRSLLKFMCLVRNTIHNNGMYYGSKESESVVYRGTRYEFSFEECVDFMTWDMVLNLMEDVEGMMYFLMRETRIYTENGEIIDPKSRHIHAICEGSA